MPKIKISHGLLKFRAEHIFTRPIRTGLCSHVYNLRPELCYTRWRQHAFSVGTDPFCNNPPSEMVNSSTNWWPLFSDLTNSLPQLISLVQLTLHRYSYPKSFYRVTPHDRLQQPLLLTRPPYLILLENACQRKKHTNLQFFVFVLKRVNYAFCEPS